MTSTIDDDFESFYQAFLRLDPQGQAAIIRSMMRRCLHVRDGGGSPPDPAPEPGPRPALKVLRQEAQP